MLVPPLPHPGDFVTIAELAERKGSAPSYMTRVSRLTLLVPDIVEAILDGSQGSKVTLARVLEPFPIPWERQIEIFSRLELSRFSTVARPAMSSSP